MKGERFHPQRIYNYYCVHLKMTPQPAFVLDISDYWDKKISAISAFQSQFVEGRPKFPSFLEKLRDEASYWGKTIGVEYGEPFACRETDWFEWIRRVGLNDEVKSSLDGRIPQVTSGETEDQDSKTGRCLEVCSRTLRVRGVKNAP